MYLVFHKIVCPKHKISLTKLKFLSTKSVNMLQEESSNVQMSTQSSNLLSCSLSIYLIVKERSRTLRAIYSELYSCLK